MSRPIGTRARVSAGHYLAGALALAFAAYLRRDNKGE